jgi:hypothetical protein
MLLKEMYFFGKGDTGIANSFLMPKSITEFTF